MTFLCVLLISDKDLTCYYAVLNVKKVRIGTQYALKNYTYLQPVKIIINENYH